MSIASWKKAIQVRFSGTNEKFRQNILQPFPFWIASLLTGLAAVLYARLFGWGEDLSFYIFHWHPWLLFLLTPACFIIGWWLVKKFAPYSSGSGIPQVIASIELATPKNHLLVDKLLGMRVLVVKVISSLFMIIGGGAIGREGPTIQIAGCIFRKVNQMTPASWPKISKKNMIMTGAAAGLAAAFNTPLGGIVFAVEELTKTHLNTFKIAILSAVIIAGLTAQALLGPYLYLGFPDVRNLSGYIFLGVVLVSVLAGLSGSIMSWIILRIIEWKRSFKRKNAEVMFVAGSALLISFIAVFINEQVMGSGKEGMSALLFSNEKYAGWQFGVVRIIGPILSFTSGAAGGIFAPSLSAGAGLGSIVAQLFELSATDANLVMLAGMVAFLTGVTRSPFTSAILVLEMTDRHSVIFHLMIAGIISVVISSIIDKKSLYEHLKDRYLQEIKEEDTADVKALPK